MGFRKFLLVFLLLGTPLAVAQPDLYTGEALVADDGVEARKQGITEAFEQMLVKITGRRSVLEHPGVAAIASRASGLMQQYRYRLVDSGMPDTLPQRYLIAHFDSAAVDRELRGAGLQPWNASRPRLLVWLAWDSQGQRSVVNTEMFSEVALALNAAADRRGFPLRLPLFDLMDQGQLDAAQIWSLDVERIQQASERYSQNAILVGRMQSKPDQQWSIAWTLLQAEGNNEFVSKPAALAIALSVGVDQAVEILGQQYAPVVSDAGLELVSIRVLDVRNVADYARVMRLFGQQDTISAVALTAAQGQDLYLDISVRGDPGVIRRGLELTGELSKIQDVDITQQALPTMNITATYRLN